MSNKSLLTEPSLPDYYKGIRSTGQQIPVGLAGEDNSVVTTPVQAVGNHISTLKELENNERKGFIKSNTGGKFFMFESINKGRNGLSDYEIGYGVKVKNGWLSSDKSKWPTKDTIPIDISKGIDDDVATHLATKHLKAAHKIGESKISTWDDMTESVKSYWADMIYNGGAGTVKTGKGSKNPKAMKATNSGLIAEGMVKSLDFIHSGTGKNKEALRGILKRRVNLYNNAALELYGVPVISEYTWDGVAKVKFKYPFTTDTMSDNFKKELKSSDNWFQVSHAKLGASKVKGDKANNNFTFRR